MPQTDLSPSAAMAPNAARYRRGLVVGKFAPLHRGHELLIRQAIAQCDEVVVISYAKPEPVGCDADRRAHWLATLFPETCRLVVTDGWLEARGVTGEFSRLPNDDADPLVHRRFVAFLCQHVLGADVDAVFTSESYGDGFA